MRMSSILALFFLLFSGCENREEKSKSLPAKSPSKERPILAEKSISKDPVGKIARSMNAIRTDNFAETARQEILSYNHSSFAEPATEDMIFEEASNEVLLSDDIRSESQMFSDDELRKAVIGRFSLLTGLIGAPNAETAPQLPQIFSYSDQPTFGDVLMLRMVKQAERVAQKKVRINDEDLVGWTKLAQSNNEVYRQIALVLFDLVNPTSEQFDEFIASYENEESKAVLRLLDETAKNYRRNEEQ